MPARTFKNNNNNKKNRNMYLPSPRAVQAFPKYSRWPPGVDPGCSLRDDSVWERWRQHAAEKWMLLKVRHYDLQALTCRLCTRFGLCTWFCTEARNLSRTDPPASRQEKGWLTTTISVTHGNKLLRISTPHTQNKHKSHYYNKSNSL